MSASPYPLADPSHWDRLTRLGPVERVGAVLRDWRHRRRTGPPAAVLAPVAGTPRPVAGDEIVLLTVARNVRAYLGAFLDHHRRLGVTRFAVVDDRSEDGTPEFLDVQPDVDRFVAPISFREAGGSMAWRDAMVAVYGRDRWYVSVDADEFLIYPGCETRPLHAFTVDLERAGLTRALGPMLDLYPEGPLGGSVFDPARHRHPTEIAPLIDGEGYAIGRDKLGMSVRGGPRTRLFGGDNRLGKFPVIFVDAATRFAGGSHHAPLPVSRNFVPVTAALLHFKFSAASVEAFRAIVAEGSHFGGSMFYRRITENAGFDDALDLRFPGSLRYSSSMDLVRRGFMRDLRSAAV